MKEVKVFRDPLYGYVKVKDEMIWRLIKTKEFQRLRRIHQLGGVYVIYHTAEHSRFSHSLGVYEVTRRIIDEVEEINNTLTDEEKIICLCAALLHDIGHGPYSHAFEVVFNTVHEQYSIDIILNENTEVHQILENYRKGFSQKVAKVIEKKRGEGSHDEIMISLISSQLDADRLDYLTRDAYNTGVAYGEIDLERLIRSFLVVDNKIAFKYTSMHAIEDYLMSRYHMYWQVYYHPVGISYEMLLVNLFKRVKNLILEGYSFNQDVSLIKEIINKTLSIEEYLELDEPWMIYKIKEWSREKDEILRDLSTRFLNRYLFKYVNCRSKEILEQKYKQLSEIFNKYRINTSYYLQSDTIMKEAYKYYGDNNGDEEPILLDVEGKLVEIAELSHVVKGIKKVGVKTDYKIYYPKEVIEHFSIKDKEKFYDIINN